jgi:hypothetical protein
MSDESTLREKARNVIHAGTLPNRRPDRTWGGPGAGVDCTICGMPVKHDDVELEIEFDRDDDDPDPGTYRVHTPCFAIWESERRNLERARDGILPSQQTQSATPASMADGASE